MSDRRHTQQFVFSGPEDTDIGTIETTVQDVLGEAIQHMNRSRRRVDVPKDEMERGPTKSIEVLIATVYLDEYYMEKATPDEMVGEEAAEIREAFAEYEIGVSTVAQSAF